jgi:hypothetical protein
MKSVRKSFPWETDCVAGTAGGGLGTNGTYKTFPELGHQSYCGPAPGEWGGVVVDFLPVEPVHDTLSHG